MALGRGLGAPRKGPKTSDLGSKTPILGGLGIPQIPHFWRSWGSSDHGIRVLRYLIPMVCESLVPICMVCMPVSSVHVLSTSLRVLST